MNQDQFQITSYRSSKKISILFFCFIIVLFPIAYFNNDATFLRWFIGILIVVWLLCVLDALNKKPILLIDKNGIWGKAKNKKISWSRILSFSTAIECSEGINTYKIDLYLKEEKIRIFNDLADQSMHEIREAIRNYSSGYDIIDKGHHNTT